MTVWEKARCEPVEETGQGPINYEWRMQNAECEERGRRQPNIAFRRLAFCTPHSAFCLGMACVFCQRQVPTRGHHVVPRCKGGTEIVPTCHSCEDFIHKTWSHNELRDTFNTVERILADPRFQKFLRWLHKQQEPTVFRSRRNRTRRPGRYR